MAMVTREYRHSAYWYAYHYGRTHSEARTYTGAYLDLHSFRPRTKERACVGRGGGGASCLADVVWRGERFASCAGEKWSGEEWMRLRNSSKQFDSGFNPFMLGACIAMDIGVAMRDGVRKMSDPDERERARRELMRDLRIIRRPLYYARETERRRRLAAERRKICRRHTTAPAPTAADVMAAWNARKESREAMVRLGGMLHDLECYVDNCLRFDETGGVVGRNGGIRGWIRENVPELSPKYKTLMRYKAMAMRLRQATDTKDPTPTSALLDAEPRHEVVEKVVYRDDPVFEHLFIDLDCILSPSTVLLDGVRKGLTHGRIRENENSMRKSCGDSSKHGVGG